MKNQLVNTDIKVANSLARAIEVDFPRVSIGAEEIEDIRSEIMRLSHGTRWHRSWDLSKERGFLIIYNILNSKNTPYTLRELVHIIDGQKKSDMRGVYRLKKFYSKVLSTMNDNRDPEAFGRRYCYYFRINRKMSAEVMAVCRRHKNYYRPDLLARAAVYNVLNKHGSNGICIIRRKYCTESENILIGALQSVGEKVYPKAEGRTVCEPRGLIAQTRFASLHINIRVDVAEQISETPRPVQRRVLEVV